ncbi:TadE family protein [Kitasatospora camelliae]|uniref:TadE family protein n=1 Tax=Kitasatospora camelliae TaxID=3156397 RepID=A0AAU8K2V3_9ACTN
MRRRGDRGEVAVEVALLAPVLVAFVMIIVAAGRVQSTGAVIDAAARAGARAASLARTPEGAEEAALEAVRSTLDESQVRCAVPRDGLVGHDRLDTPSGPLETVTVRVSCTVPFGDLMSVDGLPGEKTFTGEFTSVVDLHRGR